MKENDWLLNNISNPTFTITDFKNVGLDTSNTSLASEETYKKLPEIQQMPQFQTDGKFDELKFHKNYLAAAYSYNNFANNLYEEDVLKNIEYHRDNIFFDSKQRGDKPEVVFTKSPNPLRDYSNTIQLGKVTENKFSAREIAQKEKTLLNPVEYEKGADPIWGDSPNDSFFDLNTRVLAQWDNDGEHIDLTTGEKVTHKKGDFKTNENGSIFYENLDGRNIYNKDVLSRLDTITEDGSTLNKYDFFDSDDKEKSVFGSVMKVAATMAPLLTPITPYYLGIGIGLQTAKLGATLGKIFAGSDSEVLSNIEGFVKSMQPSVSNYSTQKMWTVENLLNLVGDVFLQLGQQRWLFEYAPSVFTGELLNTAKAQQLKRASLLDETQILNQNKILEYIENQGLKGLPNLEMAKKLKVEAQLKNLIEKYNNIGKYISRAYMTGITTADAYGEAKREGASDIEAAFLTLGYTFAEYGLLSTALGERILPELRLEKMRWKDLQKKLAVIPEVKSSTGNAVEDKINKYKWFKKLFNIGYDAATASKTIGPRVASTIFANALGEGIEETTEELLLDLSKSVFNGIRYLNGNDDRLTYWDNMFDRYSMSFLGGIIGGGLTELRPSIRNARNIKNSDLNSQQAFQELVDIVRSKKDGEFLKTLNKNVLARKDLTLDTEEINYGDYSKIIYKPVNNKNDISQDQAAKNQIISLVTDIKNILNSEGANISDEIVLELLNGVRTDYKHLLLRNSATASIYLQDFNTTMSDLSAAIIEYNKLNSTAGRLLNDIKDEDKKAQEEYDKSLSDLKNKITLLQDKKKTFFDGTKRNEFTQLLTFEMSQAVREAYVGAVDFRTFVEATTKKLFTEVSDAEIKTLRTKWDDYKKGKYKDDLILSFDIHKSIGAKFAEILNSSKEYDIDESKSLLINTENYILTLFEGSEGLLNASNGVEVIKRMSKTLDLNETFNKIIDFVRYLSDDESNAKIDELIALKDVNLLKNEIFPSALNYALLVFSQSLELGFMNPMVREFINTVANNVYQYYDDLLTMGLNIDIQNLQNAGNLISNLSMPIVADSTMMNLLKKFTVAVDTNLDITTLFKDINKAFIDTNGSIDNFNIKPSIRENLSYVIKLLNLFEALVLSARTDKANFDNILGLNVTINEIDKNVKLPELDSHLADAMLLDIKLLKDRLISVENLLRALAGQKIVEQEATAANFQLLIYKRLKDFQLPDSWDTTNWKESLNKLEKTHGLLSKIGDKLSIDEMDSVNLEFIILENAIHDLYEINKDKFDENTTKQFMSNFNLLVDKTTILKNGITSLDDINLFWFLVTRMSVKPNDFYYNYKQVINNNIAPFTTQLQAVYTSFASIINKQVFLDFSKMFNDKVSNQIKLLSEKELRAKELYSEYSNSSKYSNKFPYITFIEGMAGTGKTKAVFNAALAMVSLSNEKLLKNVWIVHATEQGAKDLAEDLQKTSNIKKVTTMSHEQYMKKIAPNWKQKLDEVGNLIVNTNELYHDGDYIFKSSLELATTTKPSLIIIDEFSRHSYIDADLTNRFSELSGAPVIAAGDYDQTKVQGTYKITEKLENKKEVRITEELLPVFNNFITSFKLGTLIRPENEPLYKSIIGIHEYLDTLTTSPEDINGFLNTFYVLLEEGDSKGLYGVKTVKGYNKSESLDSWKDKLRQHINLLKQSLKTINGELLKIGFIYGSEESETYKLVMNEFSDIITPFKGTSAQGFESLYYILDDFTTTAEFNGKKMYNWNKFYTDLYTSITRTKQGILWVKNVEEPAEIRNTEIKTEDPSISIFDANVIKNYSEKIKSKLEQSYPEGKEIKFKPFTKNTINSNNEEEENEDPETGLNEEDFNTSESLDETMKNLREKLLKINEEITPLYKILQGGFNLLHYSDFSRELGAIVDENGDIILPPNTNERLDNLNGLVTLMPNKDIHRVKDKLNYLRHLIMSKPYSLNELAEIINNSLDLNLANPQVNFIIKKYSKKEHSSEKFNRDPSEKIDSLLIGRDPNTFKTLEEDKEAKESLSSNNISLVFGDAEHGDLLEISLVTLPNFKTILGLSEFEDIVKLFNIDIKALDKSSNLINLLMSFNTYLKNNDDSDPNYKIVKYLRDFLNVYTLVSDSIININKLPGLEDWSFGENATTFGPRVFNKDLGLNYSNNNFKSYKGYYYTANDLADFEKSGLHTSKIYISLQDNIQLENGKTVVLAPKGMPFILVSEESELSLGKSLKDTYIQDLIKYGKSDRITLVLLNPPQASLTEYLENIKNVLNNAPSNKKSIGNTFSAYRLLSVLINNPNITIPAQVNKDAILKYIDTIKNSENFEEAIEKLKLLTSKGHTKINGKPVTIKNYFQAALYNLMYDEDGKLLGNNKAILENILLKNNWKGIFYNVNYDKGLNTSGYIVEANIDNNSLSIDGNDFLLAGKVSKSSYILDMSVIYDKIYEGKVLFLKPIESGSKIKEKVSNHTKDYIKGKTLNGKAKIKSNLELFIDLFKPSLHNKLSNLLLNFDKNASNEKFEEELLKKGFIHIPSINGQSILIQLPTNFKFDGKIIDKKPLEKGQITQYELITNNNKLYLITIKENINGIFDGEMLEITKKEIKVDPANMNSIVEKAKVLSKFSTSVVDDINYPILMQKIPDLFNIDLNYLPGYKNEMFEKILLNNVDFLNDGGTVNDLIEEFNDLIESLNIEPEFIEPLTKIKDKMIEIISNTNNTIEKEEQTNQCEIIKIRIL